MTHPFRLTTLQGRQYIAGTADGPANRVRDRRCGMRSPMAPRSVLIAMIVAAASTLAAQSPAGFPNDPGNGLPKTPLINPIAQGFLGRNWALDRQVKDPALRGNCGS